MGPRFDQLRGALEAKRAELATTTGESDPELVAVFDVIGSVDTFFKAAAKVPGLEFLFAMQEESIDPDDDFFYQDQDGEPADDLVPQSLYMVMSNAQAVTELIRLFGLWQNDPTITLERGLNPLKEIFALLYDIRRWGPIDRVRETGLIDAWREDVEVASQQTMRAEVELWYRDDPQKRATAQARVESTLGALNGRVIASTAVPQILHHGLLVEIPRAHVEQVVRDGAGAIDLLTVEDIMFVAPSAQHAVRTPEWRDRLPEHAVDEQTPHGEPRVALIDGLPLANHVVLRDRLVIDDPDDAAAHYRASQQRHATAMASLIAHGTLDNPGSALTHQLYVRPVLRPQSFPTESEVFPDDALLIDILHRALRRIFEGDATAPPAAPTVQVVNLSLGDPARVFTRRMSPHARLLDWFAHRHNIVIVVSAGNHDGLQCYPAVPADHLDDPNALRADAVRFLRTTERHRRLLAPAEAINAITVGALHSDGGARLSVPPRLLDVLIDDSPASYSAVGFGFRRAVKPELFLPGGKVLFERPLTSDGDGIHPLQPVWSNDVAGLAVAAPGLAGELDGMCRSAGTSNAAALATRSLALILETLAQAQNGDDEFPFPADEFHPVLAKALLIHAASWGSLNGTMTEILELSGTGRRHTLTQLLGYGPLRSETLASATSRRVVLLGAGSIRGGRRDAYRFPLPPALRATAEWRRLTITLAWLSAIEPRTQRYRAARLSFSPPKDDLAVAPVEADGRAVTRGTVQHQVLEGNHAVAFADGQAMTINVDCRIDVGPSTTQTRYGLVASLEVGAAITADIHSQVRDALLVRARAQVRERIRPSTM